MTTETKPTAPAPHLWVVQYDSESGSIVFNDGSAWERRYEGNTPRLECVWQPTTHKVPIDRKALDKLLEVAVDMRKEVIAEQRRRTGGVNVAASLDYAIDAAKEALGAFEI